MKVADRVILKLSEEDVKKAVELYLTEGAYGAQFHVADVIPLTKEGSYILQVNLEKLIPLPTSQKEKGK